MWANQNAAKLWWLGVSVPAIVLVETLGAVTAMVFLAVFVGRALPHWMAIRG